MQTVTHPPPQLTSPCHDCDHAEMAAIIFTSTFLFNLHVLTEYYTTMYTLDSTGHTEVFKEVSFHVVLRLLREYFMTLMCNCIITHCMVFGVVLLDI